jgi:hypothetical protein
MVLDPARIALSTAASFQQRPAAASNGTDYFVVWNNGFNIYGTRVVQGHARPVDIEAVIPHDEIVRPV